jgi:prepilin-type N-terminal cleavage/methylation domain-containing protein
MKGEAMKESKGFSLVDLLLAMVVLGILAAVAFPRYVSSMHRAMEAKVKANMHAAQAACEDFASMTDGIYPHDFAEPVSVANPLMAGNDRTIAGIHEGINPVEPCMMPPDIKNPVSKVGWAFFSCGAPVATPPVHPGGLVAPAVGGSMDQGSIMYNSADISGGAAVTGALGGNARKYAIFGYGVINNMPQILESAR